MTADFPAPVIRPGRVRRVRALLAGALVLGIGAGATAASWGDRHHGRGVFRTGFLAVESTTVAPYIPAGPWVQAEPGSPGPVLAFQAAGLYPGDSVYAPIAVRTRTGSVPAALTLGGAEVTASGTGSADLGAALRYRVVRSSDCGAAAFTAVADYLVGDEDQFRPLTAGQDRAVPVPLPVGTPSEPGEPVRLCFEVTLPTGAPGDLQGHTAEAVWPFTTTSRSS